MSETQKNKQQEKMEEEGDDGEYKVEGMNDDYSGPRPRLALLIRGLPPHVTEAALPFPGPFAFCVVERCPSTGMCTGAAVIHFGDPLVNPSCVLPLLETIIYCWRMGWLCEPLGGDTILTPDMILTTAAEMFQRELKGVLEQFHERVAADPLLFCSADVWNDLDGLFGIGSGGVRQLLQMSLREAPQSWKPEFSSFLSVAEARHQVEEDMRRIMRLLWAVQADFVGHTQRLCGQLFGAGPRGGTVSEEDQEVLRFLELCARYGGAFVTVRPGMGMFLPARPASTRRATGFPCGTVMRSSAENSYATGAQGWSVEGAWS
jgi:hypothetical protein